MGKLKARIVVSADLRQLDQRTVTLWGYEASFIGEKLVFLDSDQYLLHEAISLIRTAEGGYTDLTDFRRQVEQTGNGCIELLLDTSVLRREPGFLG
jgi:hypothetical protein